jgi:hypothetical protein
MKIGDNEKVLVDNVDTFLKSAKLVYNTTDFTSATILYFKALFSVLDLIILKDKGIIPKDHPERFRILESSYHELYKFLDKIYPDYRSTYTSILNKEICDRVRKNVEKIIREQGISKNNK